MKEEEEGGLVSIWSIKEGQRARFTALCVICTGFSWVAYFILIIKRGIDGDFSFIDFQFFVEGLRNLGSIGASWAVVSYLLIVGHDVMGAIRDYVRKKQIAEGRREQLRKFREFAEENGFEELLRFIEQQEAEQGEDSEVSRPLPPAPRVRS